MTARPLVKRWQITVQEFRDARGKRATKITRRIPELHAAETLFIRSRKRAQEKIDEWLR